MNIKMKQLLSEVSFLILGKKSSNLSTLIKMSKNPLKKARIVTMGM
jgi:hypothetical protein